MIVLFARSGQCFKPPGLKLPSDDMEYNSIFTFIRRILGPDNTIIR